MREQLLDCGLLWVPFVHNGEINPAIGGEFLKHCEDSLERMAQESESDRLGQNYSGAGLGLNKMLLYSLVFDPFDMRPVFASGCQKVGDRSVRVFSRYYVFKDRRTDMREVGLFAKSDNFELLTKEIELFSQSRPFIFWSRDRGTLFFKRLKGERPEIFSSWEVYPHNIELLYPQNFQGLFFVNKTGMPAEEVISKDLVYSR